MSRGGDKASYEHIPCPLMYLLDAKRRRSRGLGPPFLRERLGCFLLGRNRTLNSPILPKHNERLLPMYKVLVTNEGSIGQRSRQEA